MLNLLFLSALSLGAAAYGADARGKVPPLPQNRCYCIQYTDNAISPYYLGKLNPPPPGCENVKYKDSGKGPVDTGLLSCSVLAKCLKSPKAEEKKRKVLSDKTSQAKKNRLTCCAADKEGVAGRGACDEKCVLNWDGILKLLAAETGKLEQDGEKAAAECLSKGGGKGDGKDRVYTTVYEPPKKGPQ
ncbi:MAG TPA: hypothetical protein DCZ92_07230 [Elusimicrobia bacterium]|nr:MAG: hypothetical protein A2016_02775 [Elusimicrobia bacterium GWF2_62_30]HBA60598.1 hypothetical protein [Elusimicrobiota bacterium]